MCSVDTPSSTPRSLQGAFTVRALGSANAPTRSAHVTHCDVENAFLIGCHHLHVYKRRTCMHANREPWRQGDLRVSVRGIRVCSCIAARTARTMICLDIPRRDAHRSIVYSSTAMLNLSILPIRSSHVACTHRDCSYSARPSSPPNLGTP